MRRLAGAALAAWPWLADAATTSAMPGIARGLGSLAVVFGALAVVLYALRRWQGARLAGGADIQCVGALALGARERVVLVRVHGRELLVGVAPGRVETLLVLDPPPAGPRA